MPWEFQPGDRAFPIVTPADLASAFTCLPTLPPAQRERVLQELQSICLRKGAPFVGLFKQYRERLNHEHRQDTA